MGTCVLWFRRDLRLNDHPALLAAVQESASDGPGHAAVVPLFVIDPALWDPAGPVRRAYLARVLARLNEALEGRLVVRTGDPADVVPRLADDVEAGAVHVSADAGPYGRRRDAAVAAALAARDRRFTATGTPYAVGPGLLVKGDGEPYQVFSAFRRAWLARGWPAPAPPAPPPSSWALDGVAGQPLPTQAQLDDIDLGPVGERAAHTRWEEFCDGAVAGYKDRRDLPGVPGTSGMSAHLKWGAIHPRTMLADLARIEATGAARAGVESYRSELCWREFYADVLWHRPATAREYLRPQFARMRYDDPKASATVRDRLHAWQEGRTGYPFVDAGMRQLRGEGWMHNRVRMVVASFLVKDLHVEWQYGARFFMRWLRDGDLASNSHGWQWVAGCGTDAAPYFRIFNPVTQGEKFDPDGTYVRRYVPELAHLPGRRAHRPWEGSDGYAHGYPQPIVDHARERQESLARLGEISGG